jgi:hypothetical protein
MVLTKAQQAEIAERAGLKYAWQVCCYCGTPDAKVEAGGVWHCPNPRCPGCAGGQIRHVQSCPACVKKELANGYDLITPCAVFYRDHAELGTPPAPPSPER